MPMLSLVDNFLNRITMYRLVLYVLGALFAAAIALSSFGVLSYQPGALLASGIVAFVLAEVANRVFALAFNGAVSVESSYITGLIVALIMPPAALNDLRGMGAIAFAVLWAVASKYIVNANKRHIFNPAAFGAAAAAFALGISPTWWIAGNLYLLPFVFAGGVLIVRKIRRANMVFAFIAAATVAAAMTAPVSAWTAVSGTFLHSSLFFLAFVMLTEPATMPPTGLLRLLYGALVGILFAPGVHFGGFYPTPEIALLIGNLFVFIVSPPGRVALTLIEKREIAHGIHEFIFAPDRELSFRPGQYLEWTLPHKSPDARGNRRYFSLASSPTEPVVRVGVKIEDGGSSFKHSLSELALGDRVSANGVAGDFTLPKDKGRKVAFIAGGIGVTPFRSMVEFMLDTKDARGAVLLYSNKTAAEAAYRDTFERAGRELGMRTVYTVTAEQSVPAGFVRGQIDKAFVEANVPDYRERTFYISGPNGMVTALKKTLRRLGIRRDRIKTDYFPGFA